MQAHQSNTLHNNLSLVTHYFDPEPTNHHSFEACLVEKPSHLWLIILTQNQPIITPLRHAWWRNQLIITPMRHTWWRNQPITTPLRHYGGEKVTTNNKDFITDLMISCPPSDYAIVIPPKQTAVSATFL